MFKKAKENKKGFTLAELLIVVAIIAVLVAISIPIFNSQLEKSRVLLLLQTSELHMHKLLLMY
ncbi:MAG: type IV pilin protein [Ruminococcus sp.]